MNLNLQTKNLRTLALVKPLTKSAVLTKSSRVKNIFSVAVRGSATETAVAAGSREYGREGLYI